MKSLKRLATDTVRRANKFPFNRNRELTTGTRVYYSSVGPRVIIGGSCFEWPGDYCIPVMINGEPMIQAYRDIDDGTTIFDAIFYDEHDKPALIVEANEVTLSTNVFDAEWIGDRWTVRNNQGEIALQMRLVVDGGFLIVERGSIRHLGAEVIVEADLISVAGENSYASASLFQTPIGIQIGPKKPYQPMSAWAFDMPGKSLE